MGEGGAAVDSITLCFKPSRKRRLKSQRNFCHADVGIRHGLPCPNPAATFNFSLPLWPPSPLLPRSKLQSHAEVFLGAAGLMGEMTLFRFPVTKVSSENAHLEKIPPRDYSCGGIIVLYNKTQWDNFSPEVNIYYYVGSRPKDFYYPAHPSPLFHEVAEVLSLGFYGGEGGLQQIP